MFTRPVSIAVLAFALCLTPARAEGQVSASVSFQLGLFDGIGIGLATPHWHHGSIFSPGFHVGFGVGIGFGVGAHRGYGYDPYYDPYDGYG
jgi:hypothetical protein